MVVEGSEVGGKRRLKIIAYFLLVVSILLLGYILLTAHAIPFEVIEIDVKFSVAENIGFDLNSSTLSYGKLVRESSATRTILVENSHNFSLRVEILVSEEIAGLISYDIQSDVVAAGEKVDVPVTLSVPADKALGDYEGKIRIEFYNLS